MWINAVDPPLPNPGPFGLLTEGGQFSQLKEWAYPSSAGCILNPNNNRGFQGNLPGSYVIHVIDENGSRPQWSCCQLKYTRRFLARNRGSTLRAYVPPPPQDDKFAGYPKGFKEESKCDSA